MPAEATLTRPRTRGECATGPRPCPWVSCKHHLLLDVNPRTGHIKYNFDPGALEELGETCSLDVAERGEHTEEEVGALLGIGQTGVSRVSHTGTQRARRHLRVVS